MAAILLLSVPSLATDGITLTATIGGGTAPYSPSSSITGLYVSVSGTAVTIKSSAISGTTLTLTLGSVVFAGAPITLTISSASNLTDSLANTATGQSSLIVANGSLNWPYGVLADIQAEMGGFNASVAADPDATGNTATINSHYQKAGSIAQAQIDSRLSGQGYATPAIQQAVVINEIWQKLAAYELYQVRGLEDSSQKTGGYSGAFAAKRVDAMRELKRLIVRSIYSPGAPGSFVLASGQPTAVPRSIAPCIDNLLGQSVPTSRNPYPAWFGYPYGTWLGWAW